VGGACSFVTHATVTARIDVERRLLVVSYHVLKYSFAHRVVDVWSSLDENVTAYVIH